MANIRNFVFYNEDSTEQISNYMANPTDSSAMIIQVDSLDGEESDIEFKVEGMCDLTQPESYHTVKCVGLGDFKTHEYITESGLYMAIISGMQRVRLNSEVPVGNIKVYATGIV